jgi:hypothetical protein
MAAGWSPTTSSISSAPVWWSGPAPRPVSRFHSRSPLLPKDGSAPSNFGLLRQASCKTGFSLPRRRFSHPDRFFGVPRGRIASRAAIFVPGPPSWRPARPSFFPRHHPGFPGGHLSSRVVILASRAAIFLPGSSSWHPGRPSFFPRHHPGFPGRRVAKKAAILRPERASWLRKAHPASIRFRRRLRPGWPSRAGRDCRRG